VERTPVVFGSAVVSDDSSAEVSKMMLNLETVGRGLFAGTVAGDAEIIHEKHRDNQ
jgi:hypothetical protein